MQRPARYALAIALFLSLLAVPTLASAQSADEILNRFNDEPTVLEVQEVAMLYAGVDPDTISGWYSRANLANLLPETVEYRLRLRNEDRETGRLTDDYNTDNERSYETRLEERDTEQLQHDVKVSWDFSEIIFNPDVLKAAREVGRQTKQREDILTTVTKLYYERRQAQVDLILTPPASVSEQLRAELRIQELTADIDALTGGWFSGELEAAGKSPY